MAAALSPLEDLVSCPVCFEIYKEPISLSCLHVVCENCVQKLIVNSGQIPCPKCHELTHISNAKKDFNKQSLVDIYLKEQSVEDKVDVTVSNEAAHEGILVVCQSCKKGKEAKSVCEDCKKYMCDDCLETHKSFPAISEHKVLSMQQKADTIKGGLRDILSELEAHRKVVEPQIECQEVLICKIENLQDDTISQVTTEHEQLKTLIDKYHGQVITEFKDNLDTHITAVCQRKAVMKYFIEKVSADIKHLKELTTSSTDAEVVKYGPEAKESITNGDTMSYAKHMANLEPIKLPEVKVERPKSWCPGEGAKIQVKTNEKYDVIQGQKQANDHNKTADKSKFKMNYSTDLLQDPFRLYMVDNTIWCTLRSGLYIYNKYCAGLGCLKLRSPNAILTDGRNNIIVSCRGGRGLNLCNRKGTYTSKIKDGCFSDIQIHQNKLFALEWKKGEIQTFEWGAAEQCWLQNGSIPIAINYGENFDITFRVNNKHVFIATWRNNCIYKLDHSGRLLGQCGEFGYGNAGEMFQPRICHVDEEDKLLVVDYGNNRVQVCDEAGEWNILTLNDVHLQRPVDAMIEGKTIWVCTDQKKLYRCDGLH